VVSTTIRIRAGLLQRLRETRGITSEEYQARLVGVDRSTLRRVDNGAQPSGAFMAGLCEAFGLGLGEAFEVINERAISRGVEHRS
jgi:transcriptional regulator with XRE-family HTH domain